MTKSLLYNELQAFGSRPGMRIGEVSMSRLDLYISGWLSHRYRCPDEDSWAEQFATNFNGFVAAKFKETRTVGASTIIAELEPEGGKQITLFLEILSDFCKVYPPY